MVSTLIWGVLFFGYTYEYPFIQIWERTVVYV